MTTTSSVWWRWCFRVCALAILWNLLFNILHWNKGINHHVSAELQTRKKDVCPASGALHLSFLTTKIKENYSICIIQHVSRRGHSELLMHILCLSSVLCLSRFICLCFASFCLWNNLPYTCTLKPEATWIYVSNGKEHIWNHRLKVKVI